MPNCTNKICSVQSTPFWHPIPTLTCISINIPSRVPTLYVNTVNLFFPKETSHHFIQSGWYLALSCEALTVLYGPALLVNLITLMHSVNRNGEIEG